MKEKGLFIIGQESKDKVYPESIRQEICSLVDIYSSVLSPQDIKLNPEILRDMKFMFTSWGCPAINAHFLSYASNLEVVFYGAGSIKNIVTDDFWARKCRITTAAKANAIPVAQYLLSQVLFSLKSGWQHIENLKSTRCWEHMESAGIYTGSTVGILSLGIIGRTLVEYLRQFEVKIIAYDPYVKNCDGVEMTSLNNVFEQSNVVACCTPKTPDTIGMLCREHFKLMQPNASFINAARGAIVRENEMIEVLKARPDIFAVLDVTWPEPPEENSPLWSLDNVVITPHIAGSFFGECARMGQYMLDELQLYLAGEPLEYEVTQQDLKIMA